MQTEPAIQNKERTATVFANDYLNRISGERIERECRNRIEAGCGKLVVSFRNTELVNSIGISILLGVIDHASDTNTEVVFSDVNEDTAHLFEMLGLTNHVRISG